MRFDVITLFPELIQANVQAGIVARAHERELVSTHTWNPRDYAEGGYRRVDDKTCGGGPGMVMMIEPLRQCLSAARADATTPATVIYFSPQGQALTQAKVRELASLDRLILVCGRYEGIDQRFVDHEVDLEISLGDYVLSGGELPAVVLIDAITRLQEGALGDSESAAQDSFENGLLDHPHFTKPIRHEWGDVPAVLLGGNHASIERWRRQQQLGRTYLRRPELLAHLELGPKDWTLIDEFLASNSHPPRLSKP